MRPKPVREVMIDTMTTINQYCLKANFIFICKNIFKCTQFKNNNSYHHIALQTLDPVKISLSKLTLDEYINYIQKCRP